MEKAIFDLKPSQQFGGHTEIASCLAVFWNSQLCERQAKDINLGSDGSFNVKVFKKSQIGYKAYNHFFNNPEYELLFRIKDSSVDFFDDDSRIGTVKGYDSQDGGEQIIIIFATHLDYDKIEIIILTRGKDQ